MKKDRGRCSLAAGHGRTPGRLRAGLNEKTVTKALKPWKNCLENTQSGRRKCHGAQPLDFSPPASSTEWGSGGRWFESSRPDTTYGDRTGQKVLFECLLTCRSP